MIICCFRRLFRISTPFKVFSFFPLALLLLRCRGLLSLFGVFIHRGLRRLFSDDDFFFGVRERVLLFYDVDLGKRREIFF